MVYLPVKDAAIFENTTERSIQRWIISGRVVSREIKTNTGRGGKTYEIALSSLSLEAQNRYWDKQRAEKAIVLPAVSSESVAEPSKFEKLVQRDMLIEKAMNAPAGYPKKVWIADIAADLGVNERSIYRWIKDFGERQAGIRKVRIKRSDIGEVRTWDQGAVDIFADMLMKNRHMSVLEAYRRTEIEAGRFGVRIGSERTAYRVYESLGAAFHEFRRNGTRGIEVNILPPILRDYSDLEPNDIWVGDQHTWNWFVVHEESGRVIRLQSYVWEDMRTRGVAGISFAEQYDSWSIGLALRDGILKKIDRMIYGKPRCVYTDWGKPERSLYLNKMRACGVDMRDADGEFEEYLTSQITDEESGVYEELQISKRKAQVRNSKAKPIERLFGTLERMIADLGLPGYAGNRAGSLTDADKDELKALKKRGGLLTARQFVQKVTEVTEKYNAKPHRGRGMQGMSPNEVFEQALERGWRPVSINSDQADVLFMKSARRTVCKTGVQIDGTWYHDMDMMLGMVRKRVEVRWDPYRSEKVLVFCDGRFVCDASAYRYGSMVDAETTEELNRKKKQMKSRILGEIRAMATPSEDYDPVPAAARRAVTRFDHAAGKVKARKIAKKTKEEVVDHDIYKILAETNRSRVFETN